MHRNLTYNDLNYLHRHGKITELIKGVFYNHASPSTFHQRIAGELYQILKNYLDKSKTGSVFIAPLDIIFSQEDVLQPDLIYVSNKKSKIISDRGIEAAPDLAIEIISDEDYDVKKKMPVYASYGVPHLWYIYPDEELIEVYRLKKTKYELVKAVVKNESFKHELFPRLKIKARRVFNVT